MKKSWTILELISWSTDYLSKYNIDNARLEAEILLSHCLNVNRLDLYLNHTKPLEKKELDNFKGLIKRRVEGEPIQYITGKKEFWSLQFKVDPRGLIPRQETELVVEECAKILMKICADPIYMMDIGTGTGVIAISLLKEMEKKRRKIKAFALDICPDALSLARENAIIHRVDKDMHLLAIDVREGKLPFKTVRKFDLVVSNPPYVKSGDMEKLAVEIKDHEPSIALDGGEDGLKFYPPIIQIAKSFLKEGGWLVLEIGNGMGETVANLISQSKSFSSPQLTKDYAGLQRVIEAQRKI